MNITYLRLKPLLRELSGIRTALERIADCYERELEEHDQIIMRPASKSTAPDPEATIQYASEEEDAIRELVDRYRREDERKAREEDEALEAGEGAMGRSGGFPLP